MTKHVKGDWTPLRRTSDQIRGMIKTLEGIGPEQYKGPTPEFYAATLALLHLSLDVRLKMETAGLTYDEFVKSMSLRDEGVTLEKIGDLMNKQTQA
jgi:hypothetical protein